MYFTLKNPKSEKPTLIYFYIRSTSLKIKYSTGLKVHPNNWNTSDRFAKSIRGAEGIKVRDIVLKLNQYIDVLHELERGGKAVTSESLKHAFDVAFKGKSKKVEIQYFTEYIKDFIGKTPNLINKTTKRPFTDTAIKNYNKILNLLLKYEQHAGKKLLMTFGLQDYNALNAYLLNVRSYSINYTGDVIKYIKTFLSYADLEGYTLSEDYHKKRFSVTKEKTEAIALNERQIQLVLDYDFSNVPYLENCRDLSIIGFWTGLRVSDFLNLPEIKPSDKFIKVVPQKTSKSTGKEVVIPLHHHIKEVLNKRGMPRMISDVKYNKYIKEVCEGVGLSQEVKGSLMNAKTKRKEVGLYPIYKLVSSHTCRRSFATNLYKMNFPTLSIMQITGHTSESSFLSYIKVTPTEHAEKLLKHWEEYYSKS